MYGSKGGLEKPAPLKKRGELAVPLNWVTVFMY